MTRPPDPDTPPPAESESAELRREEEAADRARGRSEGSGQAPKLDDIDVPHPDTAPSAGETENTAPTD
ncbi:MAG: hypothetical protein IT303_17760 [Dehalococcoidia bacterium]|nr:hypothetical protein [Dehalococcoidia bacterium]